MGPWNLGVGTFKLVAILVVIAMAVIFYIGIQPPNDWALEITVGFLVITGIVWIAFENRASRVRRSATSSRSVRPRSRPPRRPSARSDGFAEDGGGRGTRARRL